MGPRYWLLRRPAGQVDLFSCQRSEARQTAGRDEPRAQESDTRVWECRRKRQYSDEARAPVSIIQEGEKGVWSLVIVFMEIQPVTRFFGEM